MKDSSNASPVKHSQQKMFIHTKPIFLFKERLSKRRYYKKIAREYALSKGTSLPFVAFETFDQKDEKAKVVRQIEGQF